MSARFTFFMKIVYAKPAHAWLAVFRNRFYRLAFLLNNLSTPAFSQVKNQFIEHAFEISSFLFFIVPMTVICVLYILIGLKLRQSKLLYGKKMKTCDSQRYIKGQSRVVRMLSQLMSAINYNDKLKQFFTFHFSCRRCSVFSMLGAVSRTTHHGCVWENNGQVIQQWRPLYACLHCANLHLGHNLLSIDLHQPVPLQYHEPQVQKRFEGGWTENNFE